MKAKEFKKSFVIHRSKWARTNRKGEEVNGKSMLLNEEGGMSCLGFDALNNRTPKKRLKGISAPYANDDVKCSLGFDQQDRAVAINDRDGWCGTKYKDVTNKRQEKLIAELFVEAGIKVTFED
jgi:hypothetical protein